MKGSGWVRSPDGGVDVVEEEGRRGGWKSSQKRSHAAAK